MLLSQSQSWKQRFGRFLFLCISSSNKCIYKASHQIFLSFSFIFHCDTLILSHLTYTPLKFPAACSPTCWDSPEALACYEWRNWIGFRYDNHHCRFGSWLHTRIPFMLFLWYQGTHSFWHSLFYVNWKEIIFESSSCRVLSQSLTNTTITTVYTTTLQQRGAAVF